MLTVPAPLSCLAAYLYSGTQPLELRPFHEVVEIDLYLPLPTLLFKITYSSFREDPFSATR